MGESKILQLHVQRGSRADDVRADGELDVASAAHLDEVLHRAVTESRGVELDLSGLFFCDVPGANLLRETASAAAHAGVAFNVRGVQGEVARVLGLLRVQLP